MENSDEQVQCNEQALQIMVEHEVGGSGEEWNGEHGVTEIGLSNEWIFRHSHSTHILYRWHP